MKTLYSVILLIALTAYGSAQATFESAMQGTLRQFDSSKTDQQMKDAAARFERIAAAEPSQWLPRYYSSFIYIVLSFKTTDNAEKQSYIDYAQKQLDEALKIAPEESELYTLQGMLYQSTIMLDPAKYGQIYSGKAAGAYQKASQLDPSNPRPVYLQGVSIMHTPEQYGGGKKAALPIFTKAMGLFADFSPMSEIYPQWGKDECQKYLAMCKENQ